MTQKIKLDDRMAQPPKYQPLGTEDKSGIYWSSRCLAGSGRKVLIALGPREPGKTTTLKNSSWRKACKKGETLIYLVRSAASITPTFVQNEFRAKLSKFFKLPPFEFSMTDAKAGAVNIYAGDFPYCLICSLNVPTDRLKKAMPANPSFMWMDEAFLDLKKGDRYLTNEARKVRELYSTAVREHPRMKLYLTGNVYSLYNPYFLEWGVEVSKLRKGEVYSHKLCWVEVVTLTDGFWTKIIVGYPFYPFVDPYSRFALDGEAINDKDIRLSPRQPRDYSLRFALYLGGRRYGVYGDGEEYWVGEIGEKEKATTLAFDIKDLIEGTRVATRYDRGITAFFKFKMARREVSFQSLSCYYLLEEIYPLL